MQLLGAAESRPVASISKSMCTRAPGCVRQSLRTHTHAYTCARTCWRLMLAFLLKNDSRVNRRFWNSADPRKGLLSSQHCRSSNVNIPSIQSRPESKNEPRQLLWEAYSTLATTAPALVPHSACNYPRRPSDLPSSSNCQRPAWFTKDQARDQP